MSSFDFGGFFEEAYECTPPKLDRVMNAFGEPHNIDDIYHNGVVTVTRMFTQVATGRIVEYNVMYMAQLEGTDRHIVTCGKIRTSRLDKVPEYEKIGKRKLYNKTKELWNITY